MGLIDLRGISGILLRMKMLWAFFALLSLSLLPLLSYSSDDSEPRSNWQLENAETRSYIVTEDEEDPTPNRAVKAMVIPIEGEIAPPQLYILRRGLKKAIAEDYDVVVLDMDTPGGRLDITLEMMEALDNFDGTTITYVNNEAISAGSYISVATDYIFMSPKSVIGAAEVVTSTGDDVNEGAKRKINSYLGAKVRAIALEERYRADVQAAMSQPDFELVIDDEVISPEGKLLTLTAYEAMELYGEPPVPLLGRGIKESVDEILTNEFGDFAHTLESLELSSAEHLAKWITTIAPILSAIGMLLIFVEFKTPGFGIFGIAGICLLAVVFMGHYVAGLAGYEAFALFLLGLVLIGLELFLFPGTLISGVIGFLLLLAGMVWSMADIWPHEGFHLNLEVFLEPLGKTMLAFVLTAMGAVLLVRFMPGNWLFSQMILKAADASEPRAKIGEAPANAPAIGTRGVAIADMYPSGEVEIEGQRHLARARSGSIDKGEDIVVIAYRDFQIVVDKAE